MQKLLIPLMIFTHLPLWAMESQKETSNETFFLSLIGRASNCTDPKEALNLKKEAYKLIVFHKNQEIKQYQEHTLPLQIARLYEKIGEIKEALTWYKIKIDTIEGLEKIFELEPNAPEIDFEDFCTLGYHYFYEHDYKKAYKYLTIASQNGIPEAFLLLLKFDKKCFNCRHQTTSRSNCSTCKKHNIATYFCSLECKGANLAQAKAAAQEQEEKKSKQTKIEELD